VLLVYLIGRHLYNPVAGLFASLLAAVSYPCVYQSHFITADAPAAFWLVLSLYFLARLFREPGRRAWQILAPLSIGLALGAKYLNLLLVLPYLYILFTGERKAGSRRFLRRALTGALLALAAFVFTTPYAVLSFDTFLNGDKNGFGGIFGARGLMFYNNFPPSLIEPFAVTSLAALNPVGLIAFLLSVVVLFRRRKPSDLLLLSFIVPFYLMLTLKSSPMLRHILPVLPLAFLAMAAALTEKKLLNLRTGPAGRALLGIVALSWLGLSLAGVERMSRTDTRIQTEAWAEANVTTETIALPTYFPYRYTPALDSFKLLPLNYDYRILDRQRPDYLIVTGPEIMVNGRADDKADIKQVFRAGIAANRDYVMVKRLAEPFRLLGVEFDPKFPTEDWNFPSPEILIYRRQSGPPPAP
jgi:4-amino-4-deoxy-L-arabinose transferase-like glycosyltransferase